MIEAEARVGDYLREEMSKILRISQAGPREGVELDRCDWKRACDRSTAYEWEVQCPHCLVYYEPKFSGTRADGSFWGITWDKLKLPNGDWNIPACIPSVRFECPGCGKPMLDCA